MKATLLFVTIGIIVSSAFTPGSDTQDLAAPVHTSKDPEPVAIINSYRVKEAYQNQFRKALGNYVHQAMLSEQNIMAEAFYEQENSSMLWLIERWTTKSGLTKSHGHPLFKAIETLAQTAVDEPSKTISINDLEPISKKEWRRLPGAQDDPFVIMLFVDSRAGTDDQFKAVYHTAMPQFRSEPGVINYQLSQLQDDKTKFVTYEKFRNEAAFQYHLNFPPIKPVIDYLNTSIKQQPFQKGLHRLVLIPAAQQL
jgi:quinol monooxygenase YgiN